MATMAESQKYAIAPPSFTYWSWWLSKNTPPQSAMADI
jgi:hypothetical protein